MKYLIAILLALCFAAGIAADQPTKPPGDMGLFPAAEIKWGEGPPSLAKYLTRAQAGGPELRTIRFTWWRP